MKVDNFFCFILSCWNFPNQITSYNAIDIFENLIMNKGALTWVEFFWSYNAKVIDYWTILLINNNKITNRNFTRIQRCTWCYWKIIVELDLVKFISEFSYLKCERYWVLNEFCWKFKQIQQIGFRRENELSVFTLRTDNTCYLIYPWRKVNFFVLS